MNEIKYLEFDDKGNLIKICGICKALDLRRFKEWN